MSTTVRELVATLGLKTTPSTFKAAEGLFAGVRNAASLLNSAVAQTQTWSLGNNVVTGVEKAGGSIDNLRLGLTALAVGASYAIGKVVFEISDMNAHLAKTAPMYGESAQSLQGLEYAAKASGSSAEALAAGMDHLNEQFKALKTGSMGAAMALSGISKTDANGKIKSMSELFADVSRKVMRFKDPAKQAEEALRIMGGAGKELLPFLQKGPEGIKELADEVKAFGAEVTDADIKATKKFREGLARTSLVVLGLKQNIAGPLIDAFGRVLKVFNAWVKLQDEGIGRNKEGRKGFEGIAKYIDIMVEGLKKLYKASQFVERWIGVFALGLAAIIATPIVLWVVGLVSALVSGGAAASAAWALAVIEFLAIAAAIFVAFLIAEDFYVFLKGGDSLIGDLIKNFGKWVDDFMRPHEGDPWWLAYLRLLTRYWSGAIDGVRNFVNFVRTELGAMFAWLEEKFKVFSTIGNIASKVGGAVGRGLSAAGELVPQALSGLGGGRSLAVKSKFEQQETADDLYGPRQAGAIGTSGLSQETMRQQAMNAAAANPATMAAMIQAARGIVVEIKGVIDPILAGQEAKKGVKEAINETFGTGLGKNR